VALLATLLGAGSLRPQGASTVEYQVKAAFLYNFAKFIEWPTDSFASQKSPMNFCIFGHDPFGSALDEVLRGKSVNNREFLARRITEDAELKTCQLVFVSWQEDKRLPEVLSSVKGASVLVVGESTDFAGRGGTVQFFLDENKLRFAVNLEAAKRARLQISSKLLALAKIVGDGAHQEVN
jgi:YfiR/HmsC-like